MVIQELLKTGDTTMIQLTKRELNKLNTRKAKVEKLNNASANTLDWEKVKLSRNNLPQKNVAGGSGAVAAYYNPVSNMITIKDKLYRVDFENEKLTNPTSGVKVKQNSSVDRAFRHFLEVNKKAIAKR